MNLFILDNDMTKSARAHVDKHVVKMPVEAAQIVCAVAHEFGYLDTPYRPTHRNHPCVRWAAESQDNLTWVLEYLRAVSEEYAHRYGREHASTQIWHWATRRAVPIDLPAFGLTPHVQCMPEQYRRTDVVEAYRAYYRGEKQHLAKWARRGEPPWWS